MNIMNKANHLQARPRRFQFGLPALLAVETWGSFCFAYPRFLFGTVALLMATLVALAIFVIFFYYPVSWTARRFHSA